MNKVHEPTSATLSLTIQGKDLTRQGTDRNIGRMKIIVIDF